MILNFILTSNHIHLLAEDNGKGDVIPIIIKGHARSDPEHGPFKNY